MVVVDGKSEAMVHNDCTMATRVTRRPRTNATNETHIAMLAMREGREALAGRSPTRVAACKGHLQGRLPMARAACMDNTCKGGTCRYSAREQAACEQSSTRRGVACWHGTHP
ncbi:hypothetical protein B296_00058239 [Ensete ventricosum]|uniref:Uncharacterized protein n=1 Tax=Ensete ventricosum TaxID=4639 RepID=A0A426XC46_ENSVE|nr:hypothetical protein B296_00058239 [Ensete ventricosum]